MNRRQLAIIHIVKKELGLSEREYRETLKSVAGVKSSKDLDEAGFRKLMRHFVRSRHYRFQRDGRTMKQKLFMLHLAHGMGWDREHLDNFIKKYYHKPGIDALTRKEAVKAIESLKNARDHALKGGASGPSENAA